MAFDPLSCIPLSFSLPLYSAVKLAVYILPHVFLFLKLQALLQAQVRNALHAINAPDTPFPSAVHVSHTIWPSYHVVWESTTL